MMENAIEAGAEDIADLGEGKVEIICGFSSLQAITKLLTENNKYVVELMEGTYVPNTTVALNDEQATELETAVNDMESLDDVIKVHWNMA
ncbi:hypothetical protein EV176_007429 [Coemansia sp. RSA 451]|nr:hypothetical protein EV176_007429 [Coemansia sp. RSA 451]